MTNKEKFLKMNVGFHYEDLPLEKQLELEAIKEQMNLSAAWIYLALSKDSLENWSKWGFNLFRKPEFKRDIDALTAYYDKVSDERFGKEVNKREKEKSIWVNDSTFNYIYEAVMTQGCLYEPFDANPSHCWCYNIDALTEEGRNWIDEVISSKKPADTFDNAENVKLCIACQKIQC